MKTAENRFSELVAVFATTLLVSYGALMCSQAWADGEGIAEAPKKAGKFDKLLNDSDAIVLENISGGLRDVPAQLSQQDSVQLSLSSIVMFALDDNPDVEMAKLRVEQAIHNTGRAQAALYPRMDMTLQQGMEYNNPAAGKQKGGLINPSDKIALTFQQLIFDGGVASNTVKQRGVVSDGAKIDVDQNTKAVLNDTVKFYLNVLRYQSTLDDTALFIKRLSDIVGIINKTYEMGGGAKTNADYAQSRMASAESTLESVKSSLNDSISSLEFLTGPMPAFRAAMPDELDPERLPLDEYVKLAEDNNTEVKTAESDIKAMKYKLKADKASYMPTVNFIASGDKSYDDGGYSGRDVNGKAVVQMTYNIFDGYDRRETVSRTESMIDELEYKRTKTLKDMKRQLKLSYNQLISLRNNISKTKAEIASSEALQNLNRQNFEQGTINLIELIEGEERLNAARGKLHQQETDVYMATYKLLIEVGLLKKAFFCSECG